MSWHSYHPDILAVLLDECDLRVVLVECETKPSYKRVMQNTELIRGVLSFQKRLYERHVIVPLFVIPSLSLYKVVCLDIRRFWEIWVINLLEEIMRKIPRLDNLN